MFWRKNHGPHQLDLDQVLDNGSYLYKLTPLCGPTSIMHSTAHPPLPSPLSMPAPAPRMDSAELLKGASSVEIQHAGQRYLLRVTRENKLILTK